MHDYQESVTTGQTDTGMDRRMDGGTPYKVIPMCRNASQATQKVAVDYKLTDTPSKLILTMYNLR